MDVEAPLPVLAAEAGVEGGAGADDAGVADAAAGAGVDLAAGVGVAAAGAAAEGVVDTGLGAETPAVLEPRPSFWRLGALSLPLGSMPLSDWNFCMALMVLESHLPVGWPW